MALHIGPIENIINVGWPGRYWVVVTSRANYVSRLPGTAHATLSLTPNGVLAGGVILAGKSFEIPADGPFIPASSKIIGLMTFSRLPKDPTSAFSVLLTGGVLRTDTASPGTTVPGFCGTTTITTQYSDYYFVPSPPPNPFNNGSMAQDVVFSTSSPAGSTSGGYTRFVADVSRSQAGTGHFTLSSSSDEIWYVDDFGNYINTHQSCDELPEIGDPPEPAKRIEGFELIRVEIFKKVPGASIEILPVEEWTVDTTSGDIVSGSGDAAWRAEIPRFIAGLNDDFQPIFDDLPDGSYNWRILKSLFSNIPPTAPPALFETISAYPTAPLFTQYTEILTRNNDFVFYETIPHDLTFSAGLAPPTDIPFE